MSKILLHSFAKALPDRLVSNDDLSSLMETSDQWIQQRTGIKTRYWATPGTTTSSLGIATCQKTLEISKQRASSQPEFLDLLPECIIAATTSPDFNFPGIGVQIQAGLNLHAVPAYDLRNQCTGFLYGAEIAAALIKSGVYKKILLVGSEVQSTGLDKTSNGRDMAVLFGDGAGSCLVESSETFGNGTDKNIAFEFIGAELHADGNHAKELWCEHPGSAQMPIRITEEMVRDGLCFPKMNGRNVFESAVKNMTEVSLSVLKNYSVQPADIAHFIPHQANIRINQMIAQKLGFKPEVVFSTIQKYGNTTAATIPIGFTDACEERDFKAGEYVLSSAFGSGYTWGAALLKVSN